MPRPEGAPAHARAGRRRDAHCRHDGRLQAGARTFTSRVTLDRPNLQILVEYLEGPFSQLENRWTFHPVGEHSCDVEFFIAYEFRSRTLGLLMGSMFDLAFRRFAVAFEHRADVVYPRVSSA